MYSCSKVPYRGILSLGAGECVKHVFGSKFPNVIASWTRPILTIILTNRLAQLDVEEDKVSRCKMAQPFLESPPLSKVCM